MQVETFHTQLMLCDAGAPLIFTSGAASTNKGYFITALRLERRHIMNCAGDTRHQDVAAIEIFDGYGGVHMPTGKFIQIWQRGLDTLSVPMEAQVTVLFEPKNTGLRSWSVHKIETHRDVTQIELVPQTPQCMLSGADKRA